MMCIAVEFSRERMAVSHYGIVIGPRRGHVSDGSPLCDSVEVDVGEKVDPAFFVLPLCGGFASIDGGGEGDEVFGRLDARAVRDDRVYRAYRVIVSSRFLGNGLLLAAGEREGRNG